MNLAMIAASAALCLLPCVPATAQPVSLYAAQFSKQYDDAARREAERRAEAERQRQEAERKRAQDDAIRAERERQRNPAPGSLGRGLGR